MNNKGYSYLEILISGTLISIIIIPITLTLYQGVQNSQFTNKRYNAVILADSLLVEVVNSIMIMDKPNEELGLIHSNDGFILEILNITNEDFYTRYKGDMFNYILKIDGYNYLTLETKPKYLFSCGDIPITEVSNINKQSDNIKYIDEIIMYKTSSLENIQGTNYVLVNENNITLKFPEYITEDITVLIYLSDIEREYLYIDIVNLSSSDINVFIYKDENFPNEDIIITQSSISKTGGVLTTVSNNKEYTQLLITVEVYNKDNVKLYNVFRPIIF